MFPRDTLLLCSDGLTRMVTEPEIAGTLQAEPDPQRAAEKLVEHANESGVWITSASSSFRSSWNPKVGFPGCAAGRAIRKRKWFRWRSLKWQAFSDVRCQAGERSSHRRASVRIAGRQITTWWSTTLPFPTIMRGSISSPALGGRRPRQPQRYFR